MTVKLLTKHHLEFQTFKRGCTGSSESTLVKIPHCWKSQVAAHFLYFISALHPLLVTLALIGKSCITGGLATLYVWSAELYPTVVRNSGMGSSSAIARIGSMLAPYIAKSVSKRILITRSMSSDQVYRPFQGGTSFVDLLCFFLSCVCYAFVHVVLYVSCGHLLGQG